MSIIAIIEPSFNTIESNKQEKKKKFFFFLQPHYEKYQKANASCTRVPVQKSKEESSFNGETGGTRLPYPPKTKT